MIPRIIEKPLSDVTVCFVDSRHKVDTVTVRWDSGSVSLHHILQILLDMIHLQVHEDNMLTHRLLLRC